MNKRILVLFLSVLLTVLCFGSGAVFAEEMPAAEEEIKVVVPNQPYSFPSETQSGPVFEAEVNNLPEGYEIAGYQWMVNDMNLSGENQKQLKLPSVNIFGKLKNSAFSCSVTIKARDGNTKDYTPETPGVLGSPSQIGTGAVLGNVQIKPNESQAVGGGMATLNEDGTILTLKNVNIESPSKDDLLLILNGGSLISFTDGADLHEKEDGSFEITKSSQSEVKDTQIVLEGKNAFNHIYENSEGNENGMALSILSLGKTTISGETLNAVGGTCGISIAGIDKSPNTICIKGAEVNVVSTNREKRPSQEMSAFNTYYALEVIDEAILNAESNSIGSAINIGNVMDKAPQGSFLISNASVNAVNKSDSDGKTSHGKGGASIGALSVVGRGMKMDNGAVFKAGTPNLNIQSATISKIVIIDASWEETSEPAFVMNNQSRFMLDVKDSESTVEREELSPVIALSVAKNDRDNTMVIDNSSLNISANLSKYGTTLDGLSTEALALQNNSELFINASTKNERSEATSFFIHGISVGRLNFDHSSAVIDVSSELKGKIDANAIYTKQKGDGISINLDSADHKVQASAKNGVAIMSDFDFSKNPTPFDPGYQAKKIKLKGQASVLHPKKSKISSGSIQNPSDKYYFNYETIYNLENTSKPAETVTIGVSSPMEPVTITKDPANVSVKIGEKASFTVENTGSLPLIYKWEVSSDGGKTWTMVENAMGSTYTTEAATAQMNGYQYRATVSNEGATLTSKAATLTVTGGPSPTPAPKPGPDTGITNPAQATTTAIVMLILAIGASAFVFKGRIKK